MSHTPTINGPWRVVRNPYRIKGWFVLSGDSRENNILNDSADIAANSVLRSDIEDESIARLIAAAPELLAALQAIADNSDEADEWDAVDRLHANADTARAAIAKAEGRSA